MLARSSSRSTPLIVATLVLVIAMANPAVAPPGDLDVTFDGDGKVTTDFAAAGDEIRALAIQDDGKIVASGRAIVSGNTDFALARYNPDGSLDTAFDGDGKVTTDFAAGFDLPYGVAVQSDGKIVTAGRVDVSATTDFGVARYNPDGTLDTTFDGDGLVTTDIDAGSSDLGYAVLIQADGKIVVVGVALVSGTNDFAVTRYNADGSLDTTFDTDGKVTTDFAGDLDQISAGAIQADGKIVAVGRALVAGNYDIALARYSADGSLDTTFDTDGKLNTDFAGETDIGYGVGIQVDGKIVVAGRGGVSGNRLFALARYNPDGSLDPAFSGDGRLTTAFTGNFDQAFAAAIQEDGRILAAGFAGPDVALARYQADAADLVLTKTGPAGRVPTGRNMTYTLAITNNGPDASSGVTVTDQLPPTVTLVSVSSSQGSCGESGGAVTCDLGTMGNGATATADIVVKPTAAGGATNTASVAAFTPDPVPANNSDSEITMVCRISSRRSSIPCG